VINIFLCKYIYINLGALFEEVPPLSEIQTPLAKE
jgi:hypothetical protein